MNPTKIVFDTDKFMNQLQTYSQALNESLKKNLKSQMEKEINSKISSKKANIDTQTLNAFKKKVSSTYTGTMPDAIYKVLIQNMSDEILASDYFKLEDDLDDDPEKLVNFLAKVSNYIYEILDKKKTTVTVDKKKYQVEFPFGTTVTMATVTDLSNNKSYSLTWKDTGATLKTLTSFMSDLIAYEKSSSYKIVKNYLLDVINIAVDDYLDYLADHATVTKNISEYLKNKLSDYKEELESIGYTINSIKEFFKAFFPQTDSGLTQIQKNYQTFTKYEAELEKAVSKLKNPDAGTIKNLTAYKNFLSAYETLSGKTLNISPEDYVTYYFKDVHNAEITQSRASIVGTSQVDSIISEGKNSTIYGESGNDALLIEGAYSKVYGGAGRDSIIIAGNNSEAQGDAGDDDIIITGANVKAEGGYGQDTILVKSSNITVTGDGETFDYIPIGDTFIIDSSARNILITDFEKSADKLQLNFSDIVVDLSFVEGEQSLVILSADKYEKIVLLQGVSESSFNNINYNGNVTSIDWLLENKKFTVKNPYENIIQVKNNTLENSLSSVQLLGSSGNDSISNGWTLFDGNKLTLVKGGDNVTISGGDGNDSIHNTGKNVFINGGNGADTIDGGNYVTINAGAGDDCIDQIGSNALVYGDSGDDTIYDDVNAGLELSNTIYGGEGNDYIVSSLNNKVTIYGDSGNDTISNFSSGDGTSVLISGGEGNDSISSRGKYYTIRAGAGNDFITVSGSNSLVYGESGKNTIKSELSFSSIIGGKDSDSISNYASNSSIYGEAGEDDIYNGSSGSLTAIDGGSGNDYIRNYAPNVTINGGAGNDDIRNSEDSTKIYGGSGNDSIQILEYSIKNITIDGGADNDSIKNVSDYSYIDGGSGNDTITNNGKAGGSTIDGGMGDDYIENNSDNNTIYGGLGNDTITVFGKKNNDIKSGAGNDSIYIRGVQGSVIDGEDNNDTIFASGVKNSTIYSGSGDDSVNASGSNLLIYGDSGKNTISNSASSSTIIGGTGDDNISIDGKNNIIRGDKGNDTISIGDYQGYSNTLVYTNEDGNDIVYGFNEDDTLQIIGTNYTTLKNGYDVIVKVGNGSIKLVDAALETTLNIQGTLSADTVTTVETAKNISNTKSNTIISGTKYADTISNAASRVTIEGAADNDSITSIGDSVSISGGAGNDTLYSDVAGSIESGSNVTITGGTGNDYISNDSAYSKLEGNDGKDTIINYGWNTTIDGGTDDDIINNFKAFGDEGNKVSINGGAGNDTINSYGKSVTISGGAGNDKIISNGTLNSYLYSSGDGNDTITGFTANDTIYINSGKLSSASVSGSNICLTIGNGSILLTDAKDKNITVKDSVGTHTFKNTYSDSPTVTTNNFTGGNDFYSNSTANTTLNALGGKDSIYNYADKVLINGGAGNDYLTSFSDSMEVTLQGDAGNDAIYSWSGKSYIDGGAGADYIYSGRSNHTLIGGKGNDSITLTSISHYTTVKYTSGDGKDKIYGLDSDDTLQITGAEYTTAKSGSDFIIGVGSDSISVVGGANVDFKINGTLKGGNGISVKNSIVTADKTFTGKEINLANYNATKVNASAVLQAVSIVGTAVSNSLKGGKGADTIIGGAGNDTVSLGSGNDVYIYSGGNDLIQDYKSEDKIKLSGGSITGASVSSSNVILNVSNGGKISVKGGKGKNITIIDGTGKETTNIYPLETLQSGLSIKSSVLTASSSFKGNKIDLADYSAATKVNASAVSQAVSIVGTAAANSIKGGKGADTISGGAGNDTVSLGGGDDVYIYSGGNDLIQDYKADEDKIKLSSGSITSASVSSSNVILNVSNGGKISVKGGKDKNITVIDSSGNETTSIYPLETLPAGILVDGEELLVFESYFAGNKIDLSSYNGVNKINVFNFSKSINITGNSFSNSIVSGKGNDEINGEAGDDKLYGRDGNDTINGGIGNDTLYGGVGNNLLTGGAGNDIFIHEGGYDIITDYAEGQDTIKISKGKILRTLYDGNNITFFTNSGTLTVINGKSKEIIIDSGSQIQTYSRTLDLMYDNNFMTNELQIDDISEVSPISYSVGQIEYSADNNHIFRVDLIVPANDCNKK